MSGIRKLGLVMLAAGFIGSAFVAVRHADSADRKWGTVEWRYYIVTFAVGLAGVIVLRKTAAAADGASHKVLADLSTLDRSLEVLTDRVASLNEKFDSDVAPDMHERIDEELAEHLAAFADAREAMIHRYGLPYYAGVMNRFALAERNINRAWSASVDGYVDEVGTCMQRAERELSAARELYIDTPDRVD